MVKVLATAIRQEKEIKGIQTGKKEVKLSLFADYMIVLISNPKSFTEKLLEVINSATRQDTQSRKHLQQWSWGNCPHAEEEQKPDLYLSPFIKTTSKWIKDLKVKAEKLELL